MKILSNNLLAAFLVLAFFTGCQAIRQNYSPEKEKTLLSCGFVAHSVDTPKKQADLASLTPYRIQLKTYKGKSMYVYGDPKRGVIYVGGPKAYAAYKKVAIEKDIQAEENLSNLEWNYWTASYGYDYAGNPSVL